VTAKSNPVVKIGVLVSGGGTNLQAIIDNIENGNIIAEIASVAASRPDAYALERARKRGINNLCINKKDFARAEDYENALADHFKSLDVELVLLAGFMTALGDAFLDAFPGRVMNIHPSLIPSFCGRGFYGLRVHRAVLARGVKVTGATVHFVTRDIDGGPIILQKPVPVRDDDTPESLRQRVMEKAEQIIYPQAVKLFCEGRLVVEGNAVKIRGERL
jgi:phosphoribosylglycinamide formyltransferase-1